MKRNRLYWCANFGAGFIAGILIIAFLMMGGCAQPTVPMPSPGTKAVPAGTPVTSNQLVAALTEEQKRVEAEQKAEESRLARALRKLEREASTASTEVIAKAQDRAEELAEDATIAADARRSGLESLRASIADAQAAIEARQSFVQNITQLGAVGLANSGLPGGGLAASLLVGIGGLLWGSKKAGDAKSERAASTAHDEAWEESKKEMLSLIAQMRGVSKE